MRRFGIHMLIVAVTLSSSAGGAFAADFGASLGGVQAGRGAAEVRTLQGDLIWTGDYNGMVDGVLGPNTRRALERWQSRRQVPATGELSPQQATKLATEAASVRATFGWTSFKHPELGYQIAYPAVMLHRSQLLAYGGREFSGEPPLLGLKVEVAPPMDEASFRTLYGSLSASRDGRLVTYSRGTSNWLVVSGETDEQGFYTRVVRRAGGVAGFTFTWPSSERERFDPVIVAMANSFEVSEHFVPGSHDPVDPRRAGVPRSPSELGSGPRQSTGLPSMPGPPRREMLDAAGVFRAVNSSVWVVLAAPSTPTGIDEERIRLGSAVAVSDRHLLTNCHTLEGSDAIVIFHRADDPRPLNARLIHLDRQGDRCVLLSPLSLPHFAMVRELEDVEIGERVYTVGAPSGLDLTLGDGLVSSLRGSHGLRYIQTTAPISPGSSGGGLFDSRGNLIGITTFLVRDGQNLNFAIAASDFWRR